MRAACTVFKECRIQKAVAVFIHRLQPWLLCLSRKKSIFKLKIKIFGLMFLEPVAQAGSRGAGGGAVPTAGDSDDGLPPAVVGTIAVGAAVLAVGTTILIAGRRPRTTEDPSHPR